MSDQDPSRLHGPFTGGDDRLTLSERERHLHRALKRLDPQLAGLFLHALAIRPQAASPGAAYLLSHAGRELSRGVIRNLAKPTRPLTDEQAKEVARNEGHRTIIGPALGLPPNHPSVSAWLDVQVAFEPTAHYKDPAPDPDRVVRAFDKLVEILWGRLGPFFETRRALEPLLATEAPSTEDLDGMTAATLRYAERNEFFARLDQPGWVRPLRGAGVFSRPPEASLDESTGLWTFRYWPEGAYLTRMASRVPEDVCEALLDVPPALKNPPVWQAVAEAALAMPAEVATRLVPLLRQALESELRHMFPPTVGKLAIQLAATHPKEAFQLARSLLRIVEESGESTRRRLWLVRGTGKAAGLRALTPYELAELLPELVAALEAKDSKQTLQILFHRVREAIEIEHAIVEGEPPYDASFVWCHDLSSTHQREEDARELLAVQTAGVAARAALRGREDAEWVLALLSSSPWPLFLRMQLFVLGYAGHLVPEQLDGFVSDLARIEDPNPNREYHFFLERQFHRAGLEARKAHVKAVIDGPEDRDGIAAFLKEHGRLGDEKDVQHSIDSWQRLRLRRFGGSVPEELRALAEKIGLGDEAERPDYSRWGLVRPTSRKEEPVVFGELSPSAILEVLRQGSSGPNADALRGRFQEFVEHAPVRAAELAALAPSADLDPAYLEALFGGLAAAVKAGHALGWNRVLPLVTWVAEQVIPGGQASEISGVRWRDAKRRAADLVSAAARSDLPDLKSKDVLWEAAAALATDPSAWTPQDDEPAETVQEALMLALNTLAGDATEAVLDVALWEYRQLHKLEPEEAFDPARLREVLGPVLQRTGSGAVAARTQIGTYLPQLLLLDREWVVQSGEVLFREGFDRPALTNPVWGGYITRQRLYDDAFEALRPWYVQAAQYVPAVPEPQDDRTWSPIKHLVTHVTIAAVRGLVQPGDADQLLELTFGAPTEDRGSAYWEIFRGWNDSEGPIPHDMVRRLADFWAWRLSVLESLPDPLVRKEEASALGWFALTEALPAGDVLGLLDRTAEMSEGMFKAHGLLWRRLGELARIDEKAAFRITDRIVRSELSEPYPYFSRDEMREVLRISLHSADEETRLHAYDLVNLLGERGFPEFGDLLDEDPPPPTDGL